MKFRQILSNFAIIVSLTCCTTQGSHLRTKDIDARNDAALNNEKLAAEPFNLTLPLNGSSSPGNYAWPVAPFELTLFGYPGAVFMIFRRGLLAPLQKDRDRHVKIGTFLLKEMADKLMMMEASVVPADIVYELEDIGLKLNVLPWQKPGAFLLRKMAEQLRNMLIGYGMVDVVAGVRLIGDDDIRATMHLQVTGRIASSPNGENTTVAAS